MNSIYCKKFNTTSLFIVGVGVLLASAFLFYFTVQAQTDADHATQVKAAIEDLSSTTGQSITSEEEARSLCNLEQYLDVCADIGKQHDLYTPAEEKQVDDFLTEVKGKILDDIKSCSDEECLIRVANELAQKIKIKNPTLATDFKLTATLIEEKNSVVQAAKEAGVDFRDCEAMDPDTASIELLRQCAKLAKDSRVQKYIPEDRRVLAGQFSDTTLVLREGLRSGKYQCGDNTLEGCGNYCLNPSVASIGAGIPEVCKQIATEVFGPDGVKQLESAHQQVGQVRDYYSKKFILTLPNGSELVGEGQIRNACDQAFSGRKLDVARACGAFAVQNGFASQAEVDKGLKLMESFTSKGQSVNFDECLANPTACRDFIPEDERNRFDAGNQIFEIMKAEIGFDPSQCERGSVDKVIGDSCFAGSKKALAKIESLGLADQSQEARFIIEDIRRHISEGDDFVQRREQFKEVFSQQGGPGGCKSEAECFSYCSNPTNGPECISFGAQQGVSGFRGEQAIQKFQDYNHNIQRQDFISDEYRPYPPGGQYPQYPGQGPYPNYQPPGQVPGFNQPGPGFSPPPGTAPYYPPFPGGPGPGPVGPSSECFAAIQSGDFVKAKAVCEVHTPNQPFPSGPVCPASPYVQCPAGEYKESYRNNDGCWVDGPCKPAPTYSYSPYPTYSYSPGPYPTYSGGPYPTYSPPGGSYTPVPSCPSGQWWDYAYNKCTSSTTYSPYPTYSSGPNGLINKTWKFKDGNTQSSSILNRTDGEYTNYVNGVYSDCLNKYFAGWKPGGGDSSNWQEFGIPVCSSTSSTSPSPYPTYSSGPYPTYSSGPGSGSCSQSLKNLLGDGCHQMYTDSSGRLIFCDGPMSKSAKEGDSSATTGCSGGGATYSPYPSYSPSIEAGNCPSGYHFHGESGGFCMNNQENYSGTCYNGSGTSQITCPVQVSCPSGQWWDSATNSCKSDNSYGGCAGTTQSSCTSVSNCYWSSSGSYCYYQSTPPGTTTYTPYPSCPSGQWWDTAASSCKSSTYTPYPSCPSGQWWDTAASSCKSSTVTGYCGNYVCDSSETSTNCPTDCGGGASYTPYPTPDQSVTCSSSGGTWNGSTCTYPTTSYTPPPYTPPPSCSSGQYWDGSACVANPTPYPTTSPTSSIQNPYMIAHCQQLDRTWNGSICQANGLFARIYESYTKDFATILRAFGF